MTSLQILITLLVIALVTILTRALPFLFFPAGKKTPEIVNYLGTVLPFAAMAMLVVYCFKSVSILKGSHGIPELLAAAFRSPRQQGTADIQLFFNFFHQAAVKPAY